jgi:hypothetical protein
MKWARRRPALAATLATTCLLALVAVFFAYESGTGKELVARAIYQHGSRAKAPFLALNPRNGKYGRGRSSDLEWSHCCNFAEKSSPLFCGTADIASSIVFRSATLMGQAGQTRLVAVRPPLVPAGGGRRASAGRRSEGESFTGRDMGFLSIFPAGTCHFCQLFILTPKQ